MEIIAFDSHKRYTLSVAEDGRGNVIEEQRIEHERGAVRAYLSRFSPGSPVAVETVGNWYWIADEIEEAGMTPLLVHARKAKLMMGSVNKTDRLDARGLNRLQRSGTLPTVWIPPMDLRDRRELCRARMYLVNCRTRFKNRIHAALGRYGVGAAGASDLFGVKGRALLEERLPLLPEHTRRVVEGELKQVDILDEEIAGLEERIRMVYEETDEVRLLQTIPGIGFLFGVVIAGEIGDVGRFTTPHRFASYAGVVPRVHASGGKVRYGQMRSDVNQYLKWAFIEAANVICMHRRRHPCRHVSRLYERLKEKKGHAKAIGAVARHLAEAAFWVLTKKEYYRDPVLGKGIPTKA